MSPTMPPSPLPAHGGLRFPIRRGKCPPHLQHPTHQQCLCASIPASLLAGQDLALTWGIAACQGLAAVGWGAAPTGTPIPFLPYNRRGRGALPLLVPKAGAALAMATVSIAPVAVATRPQNGTPRAPGVQEDAVGGGVGWQKGPPAAGFLPGHQLPACGMTQGGLGGFAGAGTRPAAM